MSQPSMDDITLKLTHSENDDSLYPRSFTHVNVDILIGSSQNKEKKIGSINAILVNRQVIAEHCFYEAFDSHSSDMQWIGCAIMENRLGRTKLQSLFYYDDTEFDFMYIEKFHIDDEYKQNGSSDVGAKALRMFLHHSFIKGEDVDHDNCWKVSSAAYVVDPMEAMTRAQRTHFQEKQEAQRAAQNPFNMASTETIMQQNEKARYFAELERADANQFLRNGFFQDPALARNGGSNARILVASCGDMSQPLKTHEQALSVTFCPLPPQITGNDAKILDAVKNGCNGVLFSERDVDGNQLENLVREINSYLNAGGGSILRSNALHAAVANNSLKVVTWLLEKEPAAINSMDSSNSTPLMVAAATAVGRSSIRGIPDSLVIDKLLASGANKSAQDGVGMTAFGRFKRSTSGFNEMLSVMIGQQVPVFNSRAMLGDILGPAGAGIMGGASTAPAAGRQQGGTPCFLTCQDIEIKLCPPTGPSRGDLSGGNAVAQQSGLVDYSEQDRQNDREMGYYDNDDDEDSMEGEY